MAKSECIKLIQTGLTIACLVYIVRIYNLTKVDPFDIKLENPETYFVSSNKTILKMDKQCKCGNEIVNDFCTEEQILSGCVDTLSQNLDKQKFLRFLLEESKCINYENQIKEGSKKLNEVFNLNIPGIHSMLNGLLYLIIISLALLGALIFLSCGAGLGTLCCGDKALLILVPFAPLILIAFIGAAIASVVLFIILIVRYYNGDVRLYVEFLDCRNVNRNKFSDKFKDIEDLKSNFSVFMTLYIIYLILNFCTGSSSKQKEEEEQSD